MLLLGLTEHTEPLEGKRARAVDPHALRHVLPDAHAVGVAVSLLWALSCLTTSSGSPACLSATSSMSVDVCSKAALIYSKASLLKKTFLTEESLGHLEEAICCSAAAAAPISAVEATLAQVATNALVAPVL